MKLGLLSQWFDPEPGGGAIPGVLANGLAHMGHDVRVMTGFPNYPSGRIMPGYRQRWRQVEHPQPGVVVHRVPLLPSHDGNPLTRSVNYLSFAASAAAQSPQHLGDSDALWVYNSPATVGSVARRLSRRHRIPFLLHVMDVWPDSVLGSGMLAPGVLSRSAERILRGVVRRTHEAASLIAVTSPGQRDLLQSRGVPGRKLHYVPLWADEAVFYPRESNRLLLPIAAQDAALVVMYAGALGHVQHLDEAIRAFAAVGDDAHLVLAGSGVAEGSLRKLTVSLEARNIHFLGQQPRDSIGDLTSAADIHLVSLADTPLMRVTMPSKIQSIMAMGKPILANCSGDAADIVQVANAGITVPPGDISRLTMVLEQLARDHNDLAPWGASGRKFYESEFAQTKAISRLEELLVQIAD